MDRAENYLIENNVVGPLIVGGTVFSANWCGGVLLVLAEWLFDTSVMGVVGFALMAIFIWSLFAAIMFTSSSTIFAASAALSTLMLHWSLSKYATTSLQLLMLTRMLVLVLGVFCVFFSFVIDSLYWMMFFSFTILFNCMYLVLECDLFWKWYNASSAIASILVGFAGVILCIFAQSIYFGQIAIEPQDNLLIGIQTFVPWALGVVAMLVTAFLTQKSDPPVALCDTELVNCEELPLSSDTVAVRRYIQEMKAQEKEQWFFSFFFRFCNEVSPVAALIMHPPALSQKIHNE